MNVGKQQGIHSGLAGGFIADGRKINDLDITIPGSLNTEPDVFTIVIIRALPFKRCNFNLESRVITLVLYIILGQRQEVIPLYITGYLGK